MPPIAKRPQHIRLAVPRPRKVSPRNGARASRRPPRRGGPQRRVTAAERQVLAFWRTLAPEEIGAGRRCVLERVLALNGPASAGSRRLHARANSALVIGAAVDLLLRRGELGSRYADFVMSCLLAHGLQGDAASPFILAHALSRLARQSERHAACLDLSVRWRQWSRRPTPGPLTDPLQPPA
jgi:hypothetical protein